MGVVTDLGTNELADRYGTVRPGHRRTLIVASGLVGIIALAWLAWAAWFQSTPDVQSSLRSFDVIDSHAVSAVVIVKPRSSEVKASCLVRAFGTDHSVVGELNFKVVGVSKTTVRTVRLRTEREATSVELVGCTSAGQARPR